MISNLQEHSEGINTKGEDGIIKAIFSQIGTETKFYVEFGISDDFGDNTKVLKDEGWEGIWMDCLEMAPVFKEKQIGFPLGPKIGDRKKSQDVKIHKITAENINSLFTLYNVPKVFDLLSIDIDYNDFYVWKAIKNKPRVVMIEYNACYPPPQSLVIEYDPTSITNTSMYFGASYCAMVKLGREKGYLPIGCDKGGSNIFFIRDDLIEGNFKLPDDLNNLYQVPSYGMPPSAIRPMLVY